MDQDEVIEHYVDRAGVSSDTVFLSEELEKVLVKFDQLNGIKLRLNVDNSWKEVAQTTIAAKQATDALTSSLVTYKVAQEQSAQANTQAEISVGRLGNSMKQNAELLVQQKLALAENTANQKQYRQQLDEGKLSLEQYIQKTSDATLRAQEYKTAIADLNKELKLAAAADFVPGNTRAAASAQNAILTKTAGTTDLGDVARINEINAAIDKNNVLIDENSDKLARQKINIGNYPTAFTAAFQTLDTELTRVNGLISSGAFSGAELDTLTLKQKALQNATQITGAEFSTTTAQSNAFKESARQIGLVYGTNSQLFKDYNTNVAKATTETANVSNAVAAAGKNSTFFSSQLDKVVAGVSNIGRTIGRLVGIGIIFAGVDLVKKFADSLSDANAHLKNLNSEEDIAVYELKQLTGVLDGAAKSVEKAFTEVEDLTKAFKDAETGVISKTDAVKLYNSTLGQTAGVVDTLDEAEAKLAAHSEAFIQFTLLKAAAQTALQKASEKAFAAAEAANKPLHDFQSILDIPASIGAGGVASGGDEDLDRKREERQKEITANQEKRRQKEIDQANAEKTALLAIEQDLYAQAEAIASKNGFFVNSKTLQEQQKLASDAIELQIQALTRYENKQNAIAGEDKNTYEIRRQALLNYNKAQQDVINLQTKQQLLFAIGDPAQQGIILAKQQTALQQVRISGQKALETLDDGYRVRRINAIQDETAAELNLTIKSNESIYKDESNSLDARLDAYQKYIAAEKALADSEFVQKLATAGFSPQEIQALEAGQKVQIQGKKITNEELEALEVAHGDKMKELASTGGKDIYDIVASYAAKQEKLAKEEDKGRFTNNAQDQYNTQLKALNSGLEKQLITVGQYEAKRGVLEQTYATARLAAQLDENQQSIKNLEGVRQDLLDQELYAQVALQAAQTSGDQSEIDANQKKLDALKDAEIKNAADIAAVRQKAATDQVALTEATVKTLLEAKKEEKSEELKLEDAAITLIKNALDGQYQNKIAEIESEITATQAKAQKEISAEQSTTDSAQVQADKIANINAREAQQEAALTKEENQQKRKQAEVDRLVQIAKITQGAITAEFDLSAKAAQATAEGALLSANPLTVAWAPLAFAAAGTIAATEVIVAGLAAVNIASILATPLPAYKFGTQGKPHPGGLALVGDGGKHELGETPTGQYFITPATTTVMDVPEGSYIHPDASKAINQMRYAAQHRVGASPSDSMTAVNLQRQLVGMQRQQTDRIVRAIVDKQELHIKPGFNSLIMIQQYGANYTKWVGNALHHRR